MRLDWSWSFCGKGNIIHICVNIKTMNWDRNPLTKLMIRHIVAQSDRLMSQKCRPVWEAVSSKLFSVLLLVFSKIWFNFVVWRERSMDQCSVGTSDFLNIFFVTRWPTEISADQSVYLLLFWSGHSHRLMVILSYIHRYWLHAKIALKCVAKWVKVYLCPECWPVSASHPIWSDW